MPNYSMGGNVPYGATTLIYGEKKDPQNWLTDPNAPWNTWAQNLEGYLQDWVSSQREGLLADLTQQNVAAGQRAIGQGLYTGTYTSSLPAENLAKMMGQNAQGYAGAMSGLQSNALAQLMSGQQTYGAQMLAATLQDLQRKADAEAQGGNFLTDFLLPLIEAGAQVKAAMSCFAEDVPIVTVNGNIPISNIKVNDYVLVDGRAKRVKRTFIYKENPTISINGIEVTRYHPFVMVNGDLLLSGFLKVGDKLYGSGLVEKVELVKNKKRVCNIEVEGHRYVVGNMLVHDGREMRG